MRLLSASELLALWEQGVHQNSIEQALSILSACTGAPWEELAVLPIGERDARLFAVYERLFGPELHAFTECSNCGERLEYSLPVPRGASVATTQMERRSQTLQLRPLNSADLAAIRDCGDERQGRRLLAERCTGENAGCLSDAEVDLLSAEFAQLDPQAEVLVDLKCPVCQSAMQVLLAIEQFLWAKISCLAKRLLREVHVLASAYGWSESEILALSAIRRKRYLELVEA